MSYQNNRVAGSVALEKVHVMLFSALTQHFKGKMYKVVKSTIFEILSQLFIGVKETLSVKNYNCCASRKKNKNLEKIY